MIHVELTPKGAECCGLNPAQHISMCMKLNLQLHSLLEEEVKGFAHYMKLQQLHLYFSSFTYKHRGKVKFCSLDI